MACGGRPPSVAERRLGITPVPEQPEARPPEPFKRAIIPPRSRYELMGQWLAFRVVAPQQRDRNGKWLWGQRLRTLLVWLIRTTSRVPGFLYAVTGGCVTATERRNRDLKCAQCPTLVRQIVKRGKGYGYKRYCGSCGCPKWFMAELGIKNRLARHDCPQGKHDGSQAWKVLMEDDWKPEDDTVETETEGN